MNPYWQIVENSSNNFSEISTFRVVKQTDFLENVNFSEFSIFSVMSSTGFWKTTPYLVRVLE